MEASAAKEEEKWGPTRSWKHYFEWKKLFLRNFSIKYFGWTPDSYRRVKRTRIIRRMPHAIKKLAIMVQFYVRVLFAWKPFEAIIVAIVKKIV